MKSILGLVVAVVVAQVALSASAALPSDYIHQGGLPGVLDLSGTTPGSLKDINTLNEHLAKTDKWKMVDLAHYCSEKLLIDQEAEAPVGIPDKLLNFSEQFPAILPSTGNTTGNATGNGTGNMKIINETMVWF
jgi:hypothetical protein